MSAADTRQLAARVNETLQRGDRRGFVEAVHALIGARAPLNSAWKSLSVPLMQWGELALAQQVMAFYARANGHAPASVFDQALIFAQSGRPDAARAALAKVPRTVPDRASNAYLRGTLALNLGEFDQAEAALLEAAAVQPASGQVWQTLASLGSLGARPALADRILAARGVMEGAAAAERGAYHYAVGKTHADYGDTEAAFAAYAEGAVLLARERPYDAAADRADAARATQGWSGEAIERLAEQVTLSTDRAIRVTGLPRSGTTLVEQILVSHSAVGEGDELARFALVANEIGGPGHDAVARWLTSHRADEATALYLRLAAERFGTSGRFIDKTLEASRYLGLHAALLPDTPIVWMRRDPLDNAWSCLRTYFALGLPWSWSQEAIAAHFRLEDELLDRWRDMLGDRLLVVSYEDLVANKQAVIPTLLDHVGLPVEEAVFTPEKTARLVTTSSVAQVRAPITPDAVDSAAPYRRHLQPFIDAYGYTG